MNFKSIIAYFLRAGLSISIIKRGLVKFFKAGGYDLSPKPFEYTFNEDGLITRHNADFMKNRRFLDAYNIGKSDNPEYPEIHWRVLVVCWAANHAKNLAGDFVECGVNKGFYSMAVCRYVDFEVLGKSFYLVDTFEGIVADLLTDIEIARYKIHEKEYNKGQEPVQYENVVKRFSKYRNVKVIKGVVPSVLRDLEHIRKVSYLSIDMNCVKPEIEAARFFWDRMVNGAIMVLDDYGFRGHIEQKKGFDQFARERDVEVLSFPTGQGIIIKP